MLPHEQIRPPLRSPTPPPAADVELPRVSAAPSPPGTARGRRVALGVLFLIAFLAVARIVAPLWEGVAFGTMMAFTAQGIYRALTNRFGERRGLAAGLTTLLAGLVVAVAGSIAIYVLTRELFAVAANLQARLATGSLEGLLGERGARIVERLGADRQALMGRVTKELGKATDVIASLAGAIIQATTTAFLGLLISLMTMYYVLVEWPRIPVRLERVLPFDPHHTRSLILEFRDAARSALIGTLATALIQGALGGIGYTIAQVPQPVTWGLFTAVGSFVPVVGTTLIFVPIATWLALDGHIGRGAFVLVWGVLVVISLADYVIRPRLVGGTRKENPLLMLISILGGLEVFGLPGLFFGPIVMAMFLAIFRIYEREMKNVSFAHRAEAREPADREGPPSTPSDRP